MAPFRQSILRNREAAPTVLLTILGSFTGSAHIQQTQETQMNVVLYGATGKSGSRILTELLARGHNVTAVARNPTGLPANVKTVKDDLSDVNKIASLITGSDAVISAYAPPQDDTDQ